MNYYAKINNHAVLMRTLIQSSTDHSPDIIRVPLSSTTIDKTVITQQATTTFCPTAKTDRYDITIINSTSYDSLSKIKSVLERCVGDTNDLVLPVIAYSNAFKMAITYTIYNGNGTTLLVNTAILPCMHIYAGDKRFNISGDIINIPITSFINELELSAGIVLDEPGHLSYSIDKIALTVSVEYPSAIPGEGSISEIVTIYEHVCNNMVGTFQFGPLDMHIRGVREYADTSIRLCINIPNFIVPIYNETRINQILSDNNRIANGDAPIYTEYGVNLFINGTASTSKNVINGESCTLTVPIYIATFNSDIISIISKISSAATNLIDTNITSENISSKEPITVVTLAGPLTISFTQYDVNIEMGPISRSININVSYVAQE